MICTTIGNKWNKIGRENNIIIIITSKLKILQIIMCNIGIAKETRSGCLVYTHSTVI